MSERFALLDHDWPTPHRDLLLELGGVLRAWRLPAQFDLRAPIPAEAIADHCLIYLDYEGPISGDRGVVRRWDGGALEWMEVVEDGMRMRLSGEHFNGEYELKRIEGSKWMFVLVSQK